MREKRKGKAERKMRIGRKMSSAGGGSHAWSSHARLDSAMLHLACGCSPYVRRTTDSSTSKLVEERIVHAWSSHAKPMPLCVISLAAVRRMSENPKSPLRASSLLIGRPRVVQPCQARFRYAPSRLRLFAVCPKNHRLLHKQAWSGVHGPSDAWLHR